MKYNLLLRETLQRGLPTEVSSWLSANRDSLPFNTLQPEQVSALSNLSTHPLSPLLFNSTVTSFREELVRRFTGTEVKRSENRDSSNYSVRGTDRHFLAFLVCEIVICGLSTLFGVSSAADRV